MVGAKYVHIEGDLIEGDLRFPPNPHPLKMEPPYGRFFSIFMMKIEEIYRFLYQYVLFLLI